MYSTQWAAIAALVAFVFAFVWVLGCYIYKERPKYEPMSEQTRQFVNKLKTDTGVL